MIPGRSLFAAVAFLAVLTCRLEAKDYEEVELRRVARGTIEFVHDGKTVRLPISLSLKIYDDEGAAFDPIEGTKFLVAGNVLNIKTETDSATRKESILEIRFVSGKVAGLRKAKAVDLKPSPDFDGKLIDVYPTSPELDRYFRSAHVGDFVEYKNGDDGSRDEILEVGDGFVVHARVAALLGSRTEHRTRVLLQPAEGKAQAASSKGGSKPAKMSDKAPKKAAKGDSKKKSKKVKSAPKEAEGAKEEAGDTEELTVGERTLVCQIKKEGKVTKWISAEVPFEGIVKVDGPHHKSQLVDFQRGAEAVPDGQ